MTADLRPAAVLAPAVPETAETRPVAARPAGDPAGRSAGARRGGARWWARPVADAADRRRAASEADLVLRLFRSGLHHLR